ncbi:MAG: hypothetical protein HY805_00450 [Nitrospirae bacterium]|nr:hypothetical protein [Nitrospirota bacterium]
MPLIDKHIKQAGHNERFVNSFVVESTPFADWVLTGIFYAALHYIEAFFSTKNIHTASHYQRDTEVGLNSQPIYSDYRDLKAYSYGARYLCKTFSGKDINESKSKLDNIKNYLKTSLPQIA